MLKVYVAGGVALALMALVAGAYIKGRSDKSGEAEAEARRVIVERIERRAKTDAQVKNLSVADLCRDLGGVFTNGECE